MEDTSTELKRILNEISVLKRDYVRPQNPNLVKLRQAIQKLSLAEHNLFEMIKLFRFSFKDDHDDLSPAATQVINSIQELAGQSEFYYGHSNTGDHHRMWIDCLELLLNPGIPSSNKPKLPHWMKIIKQSKNLFKQNEILNRRIDQLRQEKDALQMQYDRFHLEKSNLESATSLQAIWGKSHQDAQLHPFFRELKSLLLGFKRATYEAPEERQSFQKLCERYKKKSKELLNDCKVIVEQSDRQKIQRRHLGRLRSLEQRLNDIHSLESKLDKLSQKLSKVDRMRSPLVVTKSKKNGKNRQAE